MRTSAEETEQEYERLRQADPKQASDADQLDQTISAEQAQLLKTEGNALYKGAQYDQAIAKYTRAAQSAHATPDQRAIYLANRAAAYLKLQKFSLVVDDTSQALALKPGYVKAHARRKEAREALNDWSGALQDAKQLNASPAELAVLQQRADEKMKRDQAEALESLKGLGNSILSNFGMSLDDLSMEKDPSTGSYNIQMKQ